MTREMERNGYRRTNSTSGDKCIRCKYKNRGRYEGEVGCNYFDEYVGESDTCDNFEKNIEEQRRRVNAMAEFYRKYGNN